MAKFFDTFNVIESVGNWTKSPVEGYGIDTLGAGFTSIMTDICGPASRPTPPDYAMGAIVNPFTIIGNQIMPVRCAPDDARAQIVEMMAGATEYRVTQALWNGVKDADNEPIGNLYLTAPDVLQVARGADPMSTLAAVLTAAYARTPHLQPVVHLGWNSALALQFGLQNLALPFVVAPGYPADAVAVTGKVTVRLSPIQVAQAVRRTDNREEFEASRFGALEFDPHQAVRAA